MMKKLAILMILVLCAVMLGGCMSGTSAAPVNSVAFIRVDAASDVNLTVDKDNKVIAVNYGMVDKTPVKKSETAYKDSTFLNKTLKEAVAEIIKVNGTDSAISVKIRLFPPITENNITTSKTRTRTGSRRPAAISFPMGAS